MRAAGTHVYSCVAFAAKVCVIARSKSAQNAFERDAVRSAALELDFRIVYLVLSSTPPTDSAG